MPTALTHADTSDTYEEGLSRVVLVHLACSKICRYSQTNSHYSRCGFQVRIIKVDGRDARQVEKCEGAPRVCPSLTLCTIRYGRWNVKRIKRQWFTNLSIVQDGDRIASASPKTGGSGEGMPATQYCQIGDLHSVFR